MYLGLVSCEKIITVKLPEHVPQLVVNGLLNPNDRVSVLVTRTSPILEIHPKDLSINNASVSLYREGVFLENLSYTQEGTYLASASIKPQILKSYHFLVSAPGFETVETIPEKVPKAVKLKSFTFDNDGLEAVNHGMTAGVFTWNFDQDPAKENFYGIDIVPFKPGNEASSSLKWFPDFDEEFGSICGIISGRIALSFPGTCLRGSGSETVRVANETTYSTQDGPTPFEYLEVTLYNISPSYYAYMKSIIQAEGLELAFSTPDTLFTNVQGGYGLIGSFTRSKIRIDL